MKTFVITVSKTFQGKHPKKGLKTNFKTKIKNGTKIHTIRANKKYWEKIVKQVNKGIAILSLREWSGKPYKSKQVEIKKFTKLGFETITIFDKGKTVAIISKYPKLLSEKEIKVLAANDGLSVKDFTAWFQKDMIQGCIIHFTTKKYNKK